VFRKRMLTSPNLSAEMVTTHPLANAAGV
jgi:hypothetical protein